MMMMMMVKKVNSALQRNYARQLQMQMKMKLFKFSMIEFKILFPSPSSDLGKKSTTTSKEQDLDMTRKLHFISLIIPDQSNSKVSDCFKKINFHLFEPKTIQGYRKQVVWKTNKDLEWIRDP
jgi:hypothetical protein